LRVAKSGASFTRSDALMRLFECYINGGLSASQEKALADAYWQTDARGRWHLPIGLTAISMLLFPEPERGFGQKMFKQISIESSLPPFRSKSESFQGGEPLGQTTIVVMSAAINYSATYGRQPHAMVILQMGAQLSNGTTRKPWQSLKRFGRGGKLRAPAS
jgi:hypothetical protein